MSRHIIANDLPYADRNENPFDSLADILAFSARDWSAGRDTAWIYGIVMGWDCDETHDHDWVCGDRAAMTELAAKFGWDEQQVARLRRLHTAYLAAVLSEPMQS